MAILWKQPEAKDRLLAAVIAASANLNMNEVARLFGQGATYDAVEGQLRKAKKLAAALKEEAVGCDGPAVTPSRSKKHKTIESSSKTPTTGRVVKTRKAKNTKNRVQPELLDADLGLFNDTASEGLGQV